MVEFPSHLRVGKAMIQNTNNKQISKAQDKLEKISATDVTEGPNR